MMVAWCLRTVHLCGRFGVSDLLGLKTDAVALVCFRVASVCDLLTWPIGFDLQDATGDQRPLARVNSNEISQENIVTVLLDYAT